MYICFIFILKIKIVQLAMKSDMFVSADGQTVKCTQCTEVIHDSLLVMAQHALNHQNQALTVKSENSPTLGVVTLVNSNDLLKIVDSKVRCSACHQSFPNNKKSTIENHLKSALHNSQLIAHNKRNVADQCISHEQFCQWLTCSLSASDISFNKISELKNFLSIFTARIIPSEPTLRRQLSGVYNMVKQKVHESLNGKLLWLSIDEATNSLQHSKFACVIIGTLVPENHTSQQIFVWDYKEIKDSWDTEAVVSLFKGVLKDIFGDDYLHHAKQYVKMFVSDAGSQMTAAARKIKKEILPDIVTFTCMCHALHNLSETILELYPKALRFVSALNNALFSSPPKITLLRTMPGFKKLPPVIILSRWGTGLRALKHWHINIRMAIDFLQMFSPNESKYIKRAKNLLTDSTISEIEEVAVRYSFIPDIINQLETRNLPMQTSIELINRVCENLLTYKGSVKGDLIIARFSGILSRNSEFLKFQNLLENDHYQFLKYAPAGSFEAERSIKYFKKMLSSDRANLKHETTSQKSFIKSNAIALKMRAARASNREEIEANAYLSICPSFGSMFGFEQEYSIKVDNEVEINTEKDESHLDDDDDYILYEEIELPVNVDCELE